MVRVAKHFILVCKYKWEVFKLCCHADILIEGGIKIGLKQEKLSK